AGVPGEEVLAHREIAGEELPVGAGLVGEPLLRAEGDPALGDTRQAGPEVDPLPPRRGHQSFTVSTRVGLGIWWSSRMATTAVPTALNSSTLGPQVWLVSSTVTPTMPSAFMASASTCIRSMASSRAS